ncbi:MAG: tyrosine-protein phosphatase [Bacteroidota bacterium]
MNEGTNGSCFLENQPNFRSLGGLKTLSGKTFRKNMVYRSGALNKLSTSDVQKLEKAGLALIIDFRSDREVEAYPSVNIPTVKETLRIIIPDQAREEAMNCFDNNDAHGLEQILVIDYRRMIRNESDKFAVFFRILESTADLPLVFHCAAGKDRTGIAAVLFLNSLGVDAESIKEDYFISNLRLRALADRLVKKMSEDGKQGEIIRPMMEVRHEYLKAAMDEIEVSFGGMETYLNDVLQVDSELLKEKYLE